MQKVIQGSSEGKFIRLEAEVTQIIPGGRQRVKWKSFKEFDSREAEIKVVRVT